MKPNKTLFGAFVISVTLIIGACQQTELSDSAPTPSFPAPAAEFVADGSDLSAGAAAAVARSFRYGNRPTRAGSDAVVRNVVTIRDAAGRPAIYAVNLQEGYLLISATKRCYPILAQIDRGTFTLDREPSGLDVVLQEMTETIEAARDSAAVFDCRSAWLPYEERTRPERVQTRMTDDEFYDIQNEWYGKWFAEGQTRTVWPPNRMKCPKMPTSVSAKPLSATTLGSTPPTTAWNRELLRSSTMNRKQRKVRSSRRNGDKGMGTMPYLRIRINRWAV